MAVARNDEEPLLFNSREARSRVGEPVWYQLVKSIDWNRVLLQAQDEHLMHGGDCLMTVLLRMDE